MSTLAAFTCMVMFAILAARSRGTARDAYRCAVVMAACWFLTTLGHVA